VKHLIQIQKKLEKKLPELLEQWRKKYRLAEISPLLDFSLQDFVLRPGKRLRPVLMVMGYAGYGGKAVPGLYQAALSFELLHDFMLVHDDIVDKSKMRRGCPALHILIRKFLPKGKNRVTGQDLALIAGDVLYAAAIETFLSIKVPVRRKEKALKRFVAAALLTGAGQFSEMELGTRKINQVNEKQILRIYDLKTALYSFVTPLAVGAILAGASEKEVSYLSRAGFYFGRAFQIHDDILGLFGKQSHTGKPVVTDLQEEKKTLLIWYAFQKGDRKQQNLILQVLGKEKVTVDDLYQIQKVVKETGSLKSAERRIRILSDRAELWLKRSGIKPAFREELVSYIGSIL